MSIKENPQLCKEIWLLSADGNRNYFNYEAAILSAGLKPQFVDRKTLTKIYGDGSHHGVVLRRKLPEILGLNQFLRKLLESSRVDPLILVVDRIQDPRNFGACLRVAACAGVDAVIFPNNNNAQISTVVAQAASGAIDLLNLVRVSNLASALRKLSEAGIWLVGSAEQGNHDFYSVDFCLPTAIVVGNEGSGMRGLTRQLCDLVVSLPTSSMLSSLNVSNAATVILYEALRQRSQI